jgi:hypothetical protein
MKNRAPKTAPMNLLTRSAEVLPSGMRLSDVAVEQDRRRANL